MTKAFRSVTLFSLLCFLTLGVAWGQQPLNPNDLSATRDFGVDSINLQNLSVGIKVPIVVKPGAIKFGFSLLGVNGCAGATNAGSNFAICGFLNRYSPNSWQCAQVNCLSLSAVSQAAWTAYAATVTTGGTCSDGGRTTTYSNWNVVGPDGATYALPSSTSTVRETGGTGACAVSSATAYTVAGGLKATVTNLNTLGSITFPNGAVYSGSALSMTDAFGNAITKGTSSYTDTLGVNPAVNWTSESGGIGEIDTYKDTTGANHQIKQILTAETLVTHFNCPQWTDQSLTGFHAVTEVDYPDGNNLYLQYEATTGGITGRISKLTLRTGGIVNYSYTDSNCLSLIPYILSRTDANGTTTYTSSIFNGTSSKFGTTTTVLDPGKNKTIYTFMGTDSGGLPIQGVPLLLTEVQTWQNTNTVASPSYTLLSTTIYCYNNNVTACPTTQAAYPILHKDVYVAPGSKTTYSRTHYDFDNGCGGSCGLVTSVMKYATFVAIGAGTADNTTTITYGSWNGSACVAVGSSIINLPCDVKTTAGANTLAESRYTYSTKGFQTQAQQWNGTSSLWITSYASVNAANGTVANTTNPLGQVTNYSYAATGSGGCNAILPTGTSKTVNSVTLTTSATWDTGCNMGKLMSATDANSNTSNFTYDLLGRPLSQADPLTYTLSEAYPSATSSTLTDSTYFTTTLTVDGLGRPIRSQRMDGASYDTVSTQYTFNGTDFQVNTSQPCITTVNADCTLNHFLKLDPLGRSFYSSTASNEIVNTSFAQNDVSTSLTPFPTGEHNKTVQTESDGMGRVISTCALQTTGGTACGQIDGNSGILNSYTYSYNANGSTNVVNVRGSQNHTDVFDTVGRDYSVFRPESGTTTYTFDKTSVSDVCRGSGVTLQGLLLKKTNNDSSYECYQYDPDGKLTDIAIANGSGVAQPECRRFRYDATSNGIYTAPTGYTANNIKGRILEASTDDCTFPFSQSHMITDEWFAYDDDGRIADVWETTPHSSGWYHSTAAYAVNGQLTSLSGVPGASAYTVVLDSNGRPYTSKYGTTVVGNGSTYNAAGQTTEIDTGTGSDKDVYTYDANTGLMKTWAFTINSIRENATLTWNANRSLKTLAITDGFNAGGTQTCNFTYDDVSRILTDNCGAVWNQSYTYVDQYNNFSKSGTTNWNPGYSATNNHITGGGYDGAGRGTYDLNNSYAWNVYGKMITANSGASLGNCGSAGVTCVTYNAFGQPAEKNVGGTITEMLYSPIGLTGIMSGQTANNFRVRIPGGAIFDGSVTNGNLVSHVDWLGSARVEYSLSHACKLDTAYSPYGEKYANFCNAGYVTFTGDYQNLYSGLYDTPNREFDTSSGSRWLSPDPARASWNAYSYPTNPNSFIDPSGLDSCPLNGKKACPYGFPTHADAGLTDGGDLGFVGESALDLLMSGIPVVSGDAGGAYVTGNVQVTGVSSTILDTGENAGTTIRLYNDTVPVDFTTGAIIGNGLFTHSPAGGSTPVPSVSRPKPNKPRKQKHNHHLYLQGFNLFTFQDFTKFPETWEVTVGEECITSTCLVGSNAGVIETDVLVEGEAGFAATGAAGGIAATGAAALVAIPIAVAIENSWLAQYNTNMGEQLNQFMNNVFGNDQ